MNYFNRKDIVRLLAEKPDMMSDFPEHAVGSGLREQMASIPGIALLDMTMPCDAAALERMCASHAPDALLPAVVYTGVERVRLSAYDSGLRELKHRLGRFMHVHMLQPVVVGAPSFRAALCLYAAAQTRQQVCSALVCAACLFYRAAVCIPLCKQCGIGRIWLAGAAPCCAAAVDLLQAPALRTYCAILPKGYGITLDMSLQPAEAEPPAQYTHGAHAHFECCARGSGTVASTSVLSDDILQRYFESFAIPFASNIISALLSGRPVDFIEAARAFMPREGKN